MSIEALSHVLNTKVGDPTRKLILLGYANHAHRDGTAAWPAVQTIADYADCSTRSVQRHLRTLVVDGFLREGDQALVSHLRRDRRPVVYDVSMSDADRLAWADSGRGDNLSPGSRGDTGDADEAHGVTPVTPRGDTAVSPEPSGNRPSSSEPSTPSLRSGGQRQKPETTIPDDFEVTQQMRDWFSAQPWHGAVTHPGVETQNFIDHAKARGSKYRDWPAAWRTWMRNSGTKYAAQARPGAPQHPQVSAGHRERVTGLF